MTYKDRTIEELRRHVAELADAWGITIIYVPEMTNSDGLANTAMDVVMHKPIENEADYAGVMHELGHCAAALGGVREDGNARRMDLGLLLVREHAAWEWAQHYAEQAGIWTAAMESVRSLCLANYEKQVAEERARVAAAKEDRRLRPGESLEDFVKRGCGDAPLEPERPKFSRRESIGDFMKRRTK